MCIRDSHKGDLKDAHDVLESQRKKVYSCPYCDKLVFHKRGGGFSRAPHFSHYEGESCFADQALEGSDERPDVTREDNDAESRSERSPSWVDTLRSACRPDRVRVQVGPGVICDAMGAGGCPVFFQQLPVSAVEFGRLQRVRPAVFLLRVPRLSVSVFRDVLYGGGEAETVSLAGWEVEAVRGTFYVDAGVRGVLFLSLIHI